MAWANEVNKLVLQIFILSPVFVVYFSSPPFYTSHDK